MTKAGSIVVCLLVLGGCATPPEKVASATPATPAASNMVCTREYKLGSSIPVVTCDAPKTEAERQQMINEVRTNVKPLPAHVPTGPGG